MTNEFGIASILISVRYRPFQRYEVLMIDLEENYRSLISKSCIMVIVIEFLYSSPKYGS